MAAAPRAGMARPAAVGTTIISNIDVLVTENEALGEIRDGALVVRGNVIECESHEHAGSEMAWRTPRGMGLPVLRALNHDNDPRPPRPARPVAPAP
jgi:hypothetical protein